MNRLERWEDILSSSRTSEGNTPLLKVCVDLHELIVAVCVPPADDDMDRMAKALAARLEDWCSTRPDRTALFDGAVKQVVLCAIAEYREHRLWTNPDGGLEEMEFIPDNNLDS